MMYGGERERDRAVEARIGGREYIRMQSGAGQPLQEWTAAEQADADEAARHRATRRTPPNYIPLEGWLPEAAFDWPIYRAAMFNAAEDARIDAMIRAQYPDLANLIERHRG